MTAASTTNNLLDVVRHYQRSIERHQEDESRLLHCITKLYDLPIKVEHLQETGIGKTVNCLRKINGEVGIAAKTLVTKWKAMVAAEEEQAAKQMQEEADNRSKGRSSSEEEHDQEDAARQQHVQQRQTTTSNEEIPKAADKIQETRENNEKGKDNDEKCITDKQKSSHSSSSSRRNHSTSKRRDDDKRKSHKSSRDRSKPGVDRHGSGSDQKKSTERHKKEENSKPEELRHKDLLAITATQSTSHQIKRKRESSCERERKSKKPRMDEKVERTREHKSGREKHKHTSNNSSSSSSSKEKEHQHRHKKSKEDKQPKDKSSKSESHKTTTSTIKEPSSSTSNKTGSKDVASVDTSTKHKRRHVDDMDTSKTKIAKVKVNVSQSCEESNDADDDSQVIGFDSTMGANFADVLGMLNMPSISTKKSKKSLNKTLNGASSVSTAVSNTNSRSNSNYKKSEKRTSSSASASPSSSSAAAPTNSHINGTRRDASVATKKPDLLSSTAKLEPLDPSIALELPAISVNYKPMPLNQTVMDVVFNSNVSGASTSSANKSTIRSFNESEALAHGISSKTVRTKIYSGMKPGQIRQVPTLFDICIRVLQKNIDALEFTGGVPFEVLRPVLEHATPQQLLTFEDFNPYVMEDSDSLWQTHVQRNYRTQRRQEMESWREMFLRCQDEKERKLSVLAESIKQQQKINEAPVRKTQLAFVDSMVKPPRGVQRRQDQFGTRSQLAATPAARVAALSNVTPNAVKAGDARLRVLAATRDTAQNSALPLRPKKAPLMAKTLQLMRGRHKH